MMFRRMAIAAAAIFTLAACTSTPAREDGAPAPGYPISIEHKYGTTTLSRPPLKVVTLGLSDQDAVLALGIKPVGAVEVKFMTALGFRVPQRLITLAGTQNAAVISSEQVDVLEVDRLIWLCADPSAESRVKADQLYSKLKVASEGRAIFVPYTKPPIGAAFSFNTVISIPYALDNALPLLSSVK